tara:strand:- start:237 stop:692 length:456 start_codon:yes stop_codon:yes gene_type:complete
MQQQDLRQAAKVHELAFSRQRHSHSWLESSLNAHPRLLCYVAEVDKAVVAYIIWAQKSGFRPESVLELDQIAVHPDFHKQGIGTALITESLPLVKTQLTKQNSTLKHIIVSTRTDNQAQKLYKKTIGAEVETVIENLYSADEVLMIARNIK